jgi:aspartyl-tRNA(Asn)/glutamyl-tRNA(Gln) amidotransferase subunit A
MVFEPRSRPSTRWGIPLGIKDLFATKGVRPPPAAASSAASSRPTKAPSAAICSRAGAGMLGKLNMDEFAMGSSNETSAYGPVISPWRARTAAMRR